MPSTRLSSIVLALAILGLVVPSGAVLTDDRPMDDVWEENGIVVAPADGPNGNYAQIDENGELAVDISDPGVNKNGQTLIRGVFVIANTGDQPAVVWLTHDGDDSITLFENVSSGHLDEHTIEQRSLHGENHSRELAPGEEIVVSVYVDTTTRNESAGPIILETLTLTAQTEETTTTTTTTTTTAATTTATTPTTTTTTTTTPTTTRTTVEENESVEIEFEGVEENETETPGDEPTNETDESNQTEETVEYQVEDIDPDEIEEEPDDPDRNPTAVITNRSEDQPEPPDREDDSEGESEPTDTVDTVANEGESVELSAAQSYIPHSSRVDRERKIADAKNITVQKGYENRPATLRFRVSRAKLGDTDPENVKVGRLTDRGWQLLETKIVHETTDAVILQARTPGFSTFAVFSSPDVTYEWTLPDGSTYVGENIRAQFDEAGRYNVTLTVTDAAGRSDTTDHRILVNDVPGIEIDAPENVSAGDRVTVHANVTNNFGTTTVRWQLPNGETAIGPNATYVAPTGDHEVTATVVDEYDARNTTTVSLGPQQESQLEALSTLLGSRFPLLTVVALTFLAALVVFGLARHRGTPRPGSIGDSPLVARLLPWRRRPQIKAFAVPRWNPEAARFEVPTLSVTDPYDELDRVELLVHSPDDTVLARKTIDLHGRTRYTATPEPIYGIPADAIHPGSDYQATVRAINTRDRTATDTQPVTWFHPDPVIQRATLG